MIVSPKEECLPYVGKFRSYPLRVQIPCKNQSAIALMHKLQDTSHPCFLLESVEDGIQQGRYTFLGYEPTLTLTCHNHEVKVTRQGEVEVLDRSIQAVIRELLHRYESPRCSHFPPFTGGLVGYFAYEYITYEEEKLQLRTKQEDGFQDVDLMLFPSCIVFDHIQEVIECYTHITLDDLDISYPKGVETLNRMVQLIEQEVIHEVPSFVLTSPFTPMAEKAAFTAMVKQAKHYIQEGDIFQVVLSNGYQATMQGSLFGPYLHLRKQNPSPYLMYLHSEELELAGASPETLVKVVDGHISTYPLAGTRKRGRTKAEDEALAKELLADPKELAEHHMLVDLGRNDLGKLCEFDSVKVTSYLDVIRFSHVMHLGSCVEGTLCEEYDALDALGALLPAGTLSGAPKFRACQIIDELESEKRGIYGGALGYFSFTGDMDFCIAIRLAYHKQDKVYVRSGAGIVADSDPQKEYEECANKAKAVFEALYQANGGTSYDLTH